jgi:hypothetical protein
MIAYEELEKALQRWKTRRAGAAAVTEVPPEISEHGIPTGITGDETPASDSTGELEIGDANIVDES